MHLAGKIMILCFKCALQAVNLKHSSSHYSMITFPELVKCCGLITPLTIRFTQHGQILFSSSIPGTARHLLESLWVNLNGASCS
jgi:hypothetical protein